MTDTPFEGAIQSTISEIHGLAVHRQRYIVKLEEWAKAEFIRRRILIHDAYQKASGWAKFRAPAYLEKIQPDGSLSRLTSVFDDSCSCIGRYGPRYSAESLGYYEDIDWRTALTWVQRLANTPTSNRPIFVPPHDWQRLTQTPEDIRFNDIPWADMRLPVLPPQPPCPPPEASDYV